MEQIVQSRANKKYFTGVVVSDKMDKTVVVEVGTKTLHGLYKKYVKQSKKYKAHDENNVAKEGDTVRIEECRPISKDKTWQITDIIERAR